MMAAAAHGTQSMQPFTILLQLCMHGSRQAAGWLLLAGQRLGCHRQHHCHQSLRLGPGCVACWADRQWPHTRAGQGPGKSHAKHADGMQQVRRTADGGLAGCAVPEDHRDQWPHGTPAEDACSKCCRLAIQVQVQSQGMQGPRYAQVLHGQSVQLGVRPRGARR